MLRILLFVGRDMAIPKSIWQQEILGRLSIDRVWYFFRVPVNLFSYPSRFIFWIGVLNPDVQGLGMRLKIVVYTYVQCTM